MPRGDVPPPGLWSSAAEEVPGAVPGRPRWVPLEVCRQESAAAPSLPPDWRGRRKRGKCRRHGREGGRREKGKGEEKGRPGTTCGSRARRAPRPGRRPPGAPAHSAGAIAQSLSSRDAAHAPSRAPGRRGPVPARIPGPSGAQQGAAEAEAPGQRGQPGSGCSPVLPRWRLSLRLAIPGTRDGLSGFPSSLPYKAAKTSGMLWWT